ncbi:MAG TPA: putative baseplate assembly protein, partial [Blastocatellia bacterium]|nr:putative baseplate assembly protein [Blastocatellia bacterium]
TLEVLVDRLGDFSTYTLRVVVRDAKGHPQPHPSFDPRFDRVDFNFKVDCPSDLDCLSPKQCPPIERKEPEISYLAKDYASFRKLILDRLAVVMPDWKERHVPDIGIALVELLAFVGDYLSYYQDAVGTEAYLETARQRISVRRHARLVDYRISEGCNARAWVAIKTNTDLLDLDPRGLYFITSPSDAPAVAEPVLTEEELANISLTELEVFEPMTDQTIQLYESHYEIHFYTWGNVECCLDRGTTTATLIGELVKAGDESTEPYGNQQHDRRYDQEYDTKYDPKYDDRYDRKRDPHYDQKHDHEYDNEYKGKDPQTYYKKSPCDVDENEVPKLHLKTGDVLIFEEITGPKTGNPSDADSAHRHAVRLTHVAAGVDPLNGQSVVEIGWAAQDALPFPLCISVLGPPPQCEILCNVSVARGNVILVDHGRTIDEPADCVPVEETTERCDCEGIPTDVSVVPGRYRPKLKEAPITSSESLAPNAPAATSLTQDVRKASAQVRMLSEPGPEGDPRWTPLRDLLRDPGTEGQPESYPLWIPQQDLLESTSTDRHFVAEIDNDGRAHLRFGDGELGRSPDAGMRFQAEYRVGNGTAGNVGAEAIAFVVFRDVKRSGAIATVRNLLPASGGTEPEPLAEAKLFAPHAFRQELQRAIIADDYSALVEARFGKQTQRAAAELRWNGSWYEALVAVDQFGREQADAALLNAIYKGLHRYRRIGHDVRTKSAQLVPLVIEMRVCVLAHFLRGHVEAALLEVFGSGVLADGRKGFFHPDNLSFGERIYLSRLVATAQAVEGVESVEVTRLERLGDGPNHEIEDGVLPLGPLEIAQVDNDPSLPENGVFTLKMGGGR